MSTEEFEDKAKTPKKGGKNGRPAGVPNIGRKPHAKFDINRKRRFIKKMEACGIITEAAEYVGISRLTVYKAMEKDPRFKERVEIAKERSNARLEREMQSRIYEGNEKLEYDGEGNLTKKTVTKDNALLVKALEANMGEKYGKKTENTNINVNVDVGESAIDKLASFLKVDLPEKEVNPAIEGEWQEDDSEEGED